MTTDVRSDNPPDAAAYAIPDWLRELRVIDSDAHFSEPSDLWTRHAPEGYKDRLPHVAVVNGTEQWVIDGIVLRDLQASSVLLPDGSKASGVRTFALMPDQVHRASYDWRARLELLDRLGIWAQVLYPNLAGFGSQKFLSVKDPLVRLLSATVYNDAMAEIQQSSENRLLPMALLPWWDIDASIVELRRIVKMGMRGIMMCSDPQDVGLPDLGESVWDPLWNECCELDVPVSFHIGASDSSMKTSGDDAPWPSLTQLKKSMVAGMMLFMGNARVIANLIIAGVLERFPALKIVSVESGIGWIPFMLESMDYSFADSAQPVLPMKPSEYFRRQVYGCFWFEKVAVERMLDLIGVNNVMFETDIPHSVCLYPDVQKHIVETFGNADPEVRRLLLQDNAAKLYRVDLSKA